MRLTSNARAASVLVAVSVVAALAPAALQAQGQSDQMVPVLIGFKERPGPNEEALVRSFRGVIKYTYHLVPAIASR